MSGQPTGASLVCAAGHPVPAGSAFCPTCGKPAKTPEQVEAEKKTARGCAWAFGGIVALVVVLAVLGSLGGDDDSGSDADAYGAFSICQTFVERRLRAPGTATFRNYFEDDGEVLVTGAGDGPYTVRSTVDAENGFGANIRTNFACRVTHVGDGNWHLDELTLDE